MEIEVDKSATRRLINATDIQADAIKRGQTKRFAMARHAEKMLNPEVNKEVQDEMMRPLRECFSALAQPYAA